MGDFRSGHGVGTRADGPARRRWEGASIVKVNLYANLRAAVGTKTVEVPLEEGGTVGDLVDLVVERHPELAPLMLTSEGALSGRVNVFVDGRSAMHLPGGLATRLTAERQIDMFPAVAGG